VASKLERDLVAQLDLMGRDERWGFPAPVTEYRFAAPRRWRFDLAWPDQKVACECEGGGWTGGRHTRGAGFESDLEKYATAQMLGWTVVRVSQRMITSGLALSTIEAALKAATPA
jgi:very-short-patch-repair endonuclease